MNQSILAIDAISSQPGASLYQNQNVKTISFLNSEDNRYDPGLFVNSLSALCPYPQELQKVVLIVGPGPFSCIRAVITIVRLLKINQPELQVYTLNLLNLSRLILQIKPDLLPAYSYRLNDLLTLYLPAGLRGYFQETYQGSEVKQSISFSSTKPDHSLEINTNIQTKLAFSCNMLHLCLQNRLVNYLTTLEEIKPLYLREPNLTLPKA